MKRKFQGKTYLSKRTRTQTGARARFREQRMGYQPTPPIRFYGSTAEKKFYDVDLDGTLPNGCSIALTGTIHPIAAGTGESQRLGRKITITDVLWRYTLIKDTESDATASGDTARLIVYLDKQCNGATAATTDILETANVHSFNNLSNSGRFKILKDKFIDLNAPGAGYTGAALATLENNKTGLIAIKCNHVIEFDSTTGAISEIKSNNIGILLSSRSGNITLDSKIRVRYFDS